jgi:predicted protein tyrosine phosphatase
MENGTRTNARFRESIALFYRDALLGGASVAQRWTLRAGIVAMSLPECKLHFTTSRRRRKEALISIRGVAMRDRRPTLPPGVPSLTLFFDDVRGVGLPKDVLGAVAFTAAHARRVHDFVDTLPPDLEMLVVHCKAGVSRSRAVAAALQRLCGEDDLAEFVEGVPNGDVYTMLLGLPPHPAPVEAYRQAQRDAARACLQSKVSPPTLAPSS